MKLKKNNLVKVITGKFCGLVDNIHHLEPEKERIYLAKATRVQYDKSPQVKKKSVKKNILVPLHVSNVMVWEEKKSNKKKKS